MKKEERKIMSKKKTYAARGLLDWQMALNVGGAILRICFSGGSMGINGVIPARYTTDNEALQRIIENTPQFNSGRIFLLHEETVKKDSIEIAEKTKKKQ